MTTRSITVDSLRNLRWAPLAVVIAVGGFAVAWGVTNRPIALAAVIAVCLLLLSALHLQRRLPRIFLGALWIGLIGYAFADKGFAYVGFYPVRIGEVLLALGVVTFIMMGGFREIRESPFTWLYLAMAAWGAATTIPYLDDYGIDALRDAALWGYGTFAFIVAACLIRLGWIPRVVTAYRSILPWLVLWIPIVLFSARALERILPRHPGTTVPIVVAKAGDMEVHLAGIAAFILVGLYSWQREDHGVWIKEWLLWIPWIGGFMIAAMSNRGGLLAVTGAFLVVLFLRPGRRWIKLALVITIIGSAAVISNVEVDVNRERVSSVTQLIENYYSIVNEDVTGGATREWRLMWWGRILDYTVFGPYFWTGKGYGINLSASDGIYVDAETRSPHNGHLSFLARSGVPGFLLWVLLQGFFGLSLLRAYLRARHRGDDLWARLDLWILAYWSAFLVNGAFDVYLEGPQGGIWFWSVFGVGVAAIETQRRTEHLGRRADPIPVS